MASLCQHRQNQVECQWGGKSGVVGHLRPTSEENRATGHGHRSWLTALVKNCGEWAAVAVSGASTRARLAKWA